MKEIPLSKGQFALVDDADYEWLSQWKWYAMWAERTQSFYAVRHLPWKTGEQRRSTSMHRVIMGLLDGDPRQVDHRNSGMTLDNQRSNLRIASASQNSRNRRAENGTVSGIKGVSPQRGKWRARIWIDGTRRNLGVFPTRELASKAYADAAALLFGEFARTA